MAKKFRRSSTNQSISGVCAGIADYTGVPVGTVRMATIALAFFTSAPVLLFYILAAVFVPVGESGVDELEVDWQMDATRVSWKGPTVPYSWGWGALVALLFGVATAAVGTAGAGLAVAWIAEWAVDPTAVLAVLGSLFWPLVFAGVAASYIARPYALTLTHSALWVERPLRGDQRVDPASIESVHTDSSGLHILFDTGKDSLHLPAPPEDVAWDEFLEELMAGRARLAQHREDLEDLAEQRAQAERLLAGIPGREGR